MKQLKFIKAIRDRFVRKSSLSGPGNAFSVNPDSYYGYFLRGASRWLTPEECFRFYRDNAAVSTAVEWIAGAFEQIKPVIQAKIDGSFSDDSEVIDLLMNPNGFQSWTDFAGEISRHYLLTHNIFMMAQGNIRFAPINLAAIHPEFITINADTTDHFPAAYYISGGTAHVFPRKMVGIEARFYSGPMRELFQIAGFSSRPDNLWGDSPLNSAAMDARQQIEGRIHNLQMLKNGGRLSLIVSFKDEYGSAMQDDEHKYRQMRINEALGGSGKAGSIAVISGDEVDIQEVGKTNKDMDYADLDRVAKETIYQRYKVPMPLVSNDAATYNNRGRAILELYDFAVLPHADKIFAGLSKFLLPRFKIDPAKFRITYNPDSITALMERTLEQLELRRKIGVETINELRDGIPNRTDIEGGDVLYQPANLIPVGMDIMETGDIPQETGEPEGADSAPGIEEVED